MTKLMQLRPGFLDANDIGILLPHPVEKPLSRCRTYPVGIQADYSKQFVSPRRAACHTLMRNTKAAMIQKDLQHAGL